MEKDFDPKTYFTEPHKGLVIVSYCKQCSAPIYGKQAIEDNEVPLIKYSCPCVKTTRAKFLE